MQLSKVWINGRFRHVRQKTGVQRYATAVAARLEARCYLIQPTKIAGRLSGQIWEQTILPTRLPKRALLWSPANSGPLLVHRQVVTLHDVAALEHPEWFAPIFAAWYRWLIPRLAQRAALILTVSEFSYQRIHKVLKVPPEKIKVVYPGVEACFQPVTPEQVTAVRRKYRLERDYFLSVGTLEPRKNLSNLIEAWRLLKPLHPDIDLVLCGTANRNFRQVQLQNPPAGLRRIGYVDDADLPALYSGALALLMPSLYEGFGLPVLEAMACGTPVIASQLTIDALQTEKNFLSVNAKNAGDIAMAMERLLMDEDLRRELTRNGLDLAHRFSWEQTAENIYAILCQVSNEEEAKR